MIIYLNLSTNNSCNIFSPMIMLYKVYVNFPFIVFSLCFDCLFYYCIYRSAYFCTLSFLFFEVSKIYREFYFDRLNSHLKFQLNKIMFMFCVRMLKLLIKYEPIINIRETFFFSSVKFSKAHTNILHIYV